MDLVHDDEALIVLVGAQRLFPALFDGFHPSRLAGVVPAERFERHDVTQRLPREHLRFWRDACRMTFFQFAWIDLSGVRIRTLWAVSRRFVAYFRLSFLDFDSGGGGSGFRRTTP